MPSGRRLKNKSSLSFVFQRITNGRNAGFQKSTIGTACRVRCWGFWLSEINNRSLLETGKFGQFGGHIEGNEAFRNQQTEETRIVEGSIVRNPSPLSRENARLKDALSEIEYWGALHSFSAFPAARRWFPTARHSSTAG